MSRRAAILGSRARARADLLAFVAPAIGAVMPVLEASALNREPEGVASLRDVLGAGMSPSVNPVRAPDMSERFAAPRSVCPIIDRSVAFASAEIVGEREALAEVE